MPTSPAPPPQEVPRPGTSGTAILIVGLLSTLLILGGGMGLLSWLGDRDGDGLANHADRCPDAPGAAAPDGCPPEPEPEPELEPLAFTSGSSCADMSFAEAEVYAEEVYTDINKLVSSQPPWSLDDIDRARAQLRLLEDCPETSSVKRALRVQKELAVVGQPLPDSLGVERWFQGSPSDLVDNKLTLFIFWEAWCPHCKREVPALQETHARYRSQGLQVVGVTKVTRSATDEGVAAFISEQGLTYPIFKEDGALSEQLNVSGIPAAALVQDGTVIWRGHPARLSWPDVADNLL